MTPVTFWQFCNESPFVVGVVVIAICVTIASVVSDITNRKKG